jgi:hypothetical protein
VIEATTDEILDYLADVIERAERFGATVLPPNDAETVAWERDGDDLFMDLAVHPPVGRRARLVEIILRERWRAVGSDRWELAEYGYELRHHELAYRRALHRHDVDYFVRTSGSRRTSTVRRRWGTLCAATTWRTLRAAGRSTDSIDCTERGSPARKPTARNSGASGNAKPPSIAPSRPGADLTIL